MKLIYAIIRNDNEDDVIQALMQEHFVVTRLSTTGGFLKKGNTTLMIAVEDSDVDRCHYELHNNADECGNRRSNHHGCAFGTL